MTTGEPVVARVAMKPLPTLTKPLRSVDIETKQPGRGAAGAHRLVHRARGRRGGRGDGRAGAGARLPRQVRRRRDARRARGGVRLPRAHRMAEVGTRTAPRCRARAAAAATGSWWSSASCAPASRASAGSPRSGWAGRWPTPTRCSRSASASRSRRSSTARASRRSASASSRWCWSCWPRRARRSCRSAAARSRARPVRDGARRPRRRARRGGRRRGLGARPRASGRRPLARDRERFARLHAARRPLYESVAGVGARRRRREDAGVRGRAAPRQRRGARMVWSAQGYPVWVGAGVLDAAGELLPRPRALLRGRRRARAGAARRAARGPGRPPR